MIPFFQLEILITCRLLFAGRCTVGSVLLRPGHLDLESNVNLPFQPSSLHFNRPPPDLLPSPVTSPDPVVLWGAPCSL